jgi:hypothetical protein
MYSAFEFTLAIPLESAIPPSAAGKHFEIEWRFEIRLDVPWAKDPRIKIPITLHRKPKPKHSESVTEGQLELPQLLNRFGINGKMLTSERRWVVHLNTGLGVFDSLN